MSLDEKRQKAGAGKSAGTQGGEPTPAWRVKPPHAAPEGISAADLIEKEMPPPQFLLDGLLAEGLTVLGGKPKHGKSWFALLIAWAVSGARPVDGRAVRPADVLYLALEDTQRRLKGRLTKLKGALDWPVPGTLTLHTAWPRAGDGGLYHIAEWLDARRAAAKFVIVDTLAKFRTPPKGSGGSSYSEDYEAIGGLKEMLDHYGASGLVLHHTRKLRSDDPFDEISGTLAITGAADSIWMLDTQTKGAEARLYVTGRDLPDATVPMQFAQDSGRWVVGANREGIDTAGRNDVAEKTGGTKVEQCRAWLKEFLKVYAYPSKEIESAAKVAGYAFSALRDAKAALGREGTGELCNHKFGAAEWWSGLGPRIGWRLRPGRVPEGSDGSDGSREHWQDK